MNIYTQRIPRTTVTKPLSPTPPPSINHQSSQTTLSCSPFKAVSLQRRSQLKATSSQTEAVSPIPKTDSSTQTSNHGNQATIATATTPSLDQTLDIPVSSVRGVREPEPTDEKEINSTSLQSNDTQDIEEAERSKQTLLQKLRELDVQTSAPSSKPLTSSPSIGPTRQSHVTVSPPPTVATNLLTNKPSMTQHDVAGEEHERKKLLLAKLMAIDEGSDPNQLKTVTPHQTKPPPHQVEPRIQQVVSTNRISANKSSTSSTSSWSEVIDNMHHGRPAHASDEDPFGSRSRLNSLKKTKTKQGDGVSVREKIFITESSIDTRQGLPIQQAELEEDRDGDGDGDGGDYKPSFGRRAQRPHPTGPRLISSSSQLLPWRPKADTTAMRSNDVMPGAIISDPDDLEELVL